MRMIKESAWSLNTFWIKTIWLFYYHPHQKVEEVIFSPVCVCSQESGRGGTNLVVISLVLPGGIPWSCTWFCLVVPPWSCILSCPGVPFCRTRSTPLDRIGYPFTQKYCIPGEPPLLTPSHPTLDTRCFFFVCLKFLENISPFCGATDTPVLDFW